MIEKIIGAFSFKPNVYAEVEKETGFTSSAWLIVAVTAFLNALGVSAATAHRSIGGYLVSVIITTIFAVLAFAVACFVVDWVGRYFFNAQVTFEEAVRTLGLAYVWNVVGVLGIVSLISPSLSCLTSIPRFFAWVAGFISWLVAAKEALDLEWPQTVGTIIIAFVVNLIIMFFASLVIGLFVGGAAVIGSAIF